MFETENPAMGAGDAARGERFAIPVSGRPSPQTTTKATQNVGARMRATPQMKWAMNMPMLLPPDNPRFLAYADTLTKQLVFFCLVERNPAPRVVIELAGRGACTQALSFDSVCLGIGDGRLLVYSIGTLIAAAEAKPQITQSEVELPPRAQGKCTPCVRPAGLTFSADGGLLFAMATGGSGITVHNVQHKDLPVLQVLPFAVGHGMYSDYRLAATDNLVIATGGGQASKDCPDTRLVQVWQVQHEQPDSTSMKLWWTHTFDAVAESVAIRVDTGLLAVGLRDGTIEVFSTSSDPWELHTKIPCIANETNDTEINDQPVRSLQFNDDGTKLAASRVGVTRLDSFYVYDIQASAALVNQFQHNKTNLVSSVAFLHNSGTEMLVAGSGVPGNYFLHALAPRGVARTLTMASVSADGARLQPLSSGDFDPVSGVVALCAGSVLQVFDQRNKLLLDRDIGEEIRTYGGSKSAVKVCPGGSLVACGLNGAQDSQVVVLEAGGNEAFRITQNHDGGAGGFGILYEIVWSPDGELLAIGTLQGALVLSVDGAVIHQHGMHASTCAFDGTGSTFVHADGQKLEVVVWDVQTWKRLHTVPDIGQWIGAVALSPIGDRVAYLEGVSDTDVVVWPLDPSSGKEPQRLSLSINARSALSFSPDGRFILCCPDASENSDPHKLRVLDLAIGTDAKWGQALRVMSLPVTGGMLNGGTLGWAQIPLQSAPESDSDSTSVTKSLAIYGAVGSQFVVADVETARDAADDAAWSTQKLIFISENHLELVKTIATTTPYCVNVQDPETRDTVFHYLARTRQTKALRTWFDNGAKVTPIENAKGQTALMIALEMEQSDVARLLWSNMANTLSFISASLILEELRILSRNHPNMVGQYLADIEPVITQTVAMFRTELTRHAEVCGLPTPTLTAPDASEDSATVSGMQSAVPHVWADRLPNDRPKMLVASNVVIVPYLLGDAKSSPFHDIVTNCDASVFKSPLLELIVQYKWYASVRSQRQWAFLTYVATFIIGSAAMLSSTTRLQELEPTSSVDVLQGSMIALELVTLGAKILRLAREGVLFYLTGFWNLLSCAASVCLLVAGVSHFLGWLVGVRSVGSLGVGMKCFGLVDYLRSFAGTASLVRMVSVIMVDMAPFMTIVGTVVIGSALVFTINSPFSPEFTFVFDDRVEPIQPLLTVLQMMLNIGSGLNIDRSTPWPTLITMLFFMGFVVVVLCVTQLRFILIKLNMLIAIMADSCKMQPFNCHDEKVKENERVEALRERAQIIVESERTHPSSHQYHKYMHVVQTTESSKGTKQLEWEGITGRVKQLLELQDERVNERVKQLEHMLQNKFQLLDSKLEMILDR